MVAWPRRMVYADGRLTIGVSRMVRNSLCALFVVIGLTPPITSVAAQGRCRRRAATTGGPDAAWIESDAAWAERYRSRDHGGRPCGRFGRH